MSVHRIIAVERDEDWDLICSECNETLTVTIEKSWDLKYIVVKPCKTCMQSQYDDGFNDGEKEN
jgi:hypothetical protein